MFKLIDMKTTVMIILCSAAMFLSGCSTSHPHATAWEYKVVEMNDYSGKLEAKLNELASEGWVVVSASTTPRDVTTQVAYSSIILKRHKH